MTTISTPISAGREFARPAPGDALRDIATISRRADDETPVSTRRRDPFHKFPLGGAGLVNKQKWLGRRCR